MKTSSLFAADDAAGECAAAHGLMLIALHVFTGQAPGACPYLQSTKVPTDALPVPETQLQ
ncbi:hypothetical protein [Chitinimonas sp.]|uniref:hypothetical protein n=1 Tax=Chitinimonas sp. TaxID=1934313 RepID=UPI0035B161DA